MTSTPVSLNDESLNGSWIDINSASQIHSPMEGDSPELIGPPYSFPAQPVQNLGLISFQVERFLQEAQRSQTTNRAHNGQSRAGQANEIDDNSGIYSSDTDVSIDDFGSRALIDQLRQQQYRDNMNESNTITTNQNDLHQSARSRRGGDLQESRSRGSSIDHLSDSLSLISRASVTDDNYLMKDMQDFDWLWDWADQPVYFTGQEWKIANKKDYLTRRRDLYYKMNKNSDDKDVFSGEVMSLLFLTNILSIIIGAGLTYSILMRKSTV